VLLDVFFNVHIIHSDQYPVGTLVKYPPDTFQSTRRARCDHFFEYFCKVSAGHFFTAPCENPQASACVRGERNCNEPCMRPDQTQWLCSSCIAKAIQMCPRKNPAGTCRTNAACSVSMCPAIHATRWRPRSLRLLSQRTRAFTRGCGHAVRRGHF